MATKAPIIMKHIGRFEGKLKPRSKPVRIADPSQIVDFSRPKIYFVIAHSKTTQAITEVASTIAEPRPK
jgi:hypothetical protein